MKSENESGHSSTNPSRQKGVYFCYIAIGLGGMCFLIGIFMAIFGNDAIAWTGVGMALYGSWLSAAFYIAMGSAGKLQGWKRFFVTPWLERSISDNLLSNTHKDSYSTLHAAKRFCIFCFFTCLLLGYFGMSYLFPCFIAGCAVALLYDDFIRRNESKLAE
jgi:hypothetical protein